MIGPCASRQYRFVWFGPQDERKTYSAIRTFYRLRSDALGLQFFHMPTIGFFLCCEVKGVALLYNFAKDDDQATQTTKVIADVDATLPTPGCPAERPIGLNIRNLSDKIVIGVSWRRLLTRKGATDNIADRSNRVKAFNRVMWPGANIEICAAMPKLTEPVTIAEAEIYLRLSHIRISSVPISKELSTLDKGFFPEDD